MRVGVEWMFTGGILGVHLHGLHQLQHQGVDLIEVQQIHSFK
jgi:hypothetical protein